MLLLALSTATLAVNDNSIAAPVKTGTVSAAGRSYQYERICPGVYRLSRALACGRVEVLVTGSDGSMRSSSDGLTGRRFAVVSGELQCA